MTENQPSYLLDKTSFNEKELVLKISEGDEAAFTQLFERYLEKIKPFAEKMTRSSEDAKEIVVQCKRT